MPKFPGPVRPGDATYAEDRYAAEGASCDDCANLQAGWYRVVRGGGGFTYAYLGSNHLLVLFSEDHRAAARDESGYVYPFDVDDYDSEWWDDRDAVGFRCAYDEPL